MGEGGLNPWGLTAETVWQERLFCVQRRGVGNDLNVGLGSAGSGTAWRGTAWLGQAGQGLAWLGSAWHGGVCPFIGSIEMPRGGNNRKPTKLKVLQGTSQKCRENPDEPAVIPSADLRAPPDLAEGKETALWEQVGLWLSEHGLFEDATRDLVAAYCREMGTYWEAVETTRKEGTTLVNDRTGQEYQHPAQIVANKSLMAALRIGQSMGLTLAERGRVSANRNPNRNKNPFAEIG